ncbi:MAG: hypothetical protein ABIV63_15250 [Caldimonas sp.]
MNISSLMSLPAALVLALASTASVAQDKPASTTASKPVTTLMKAAQADKRRATSLHDAPARTVKQVTETEMAPAAPKSMPLSERSYDECHHGKDSDA